jgi:hypothetical protein
MTPIRFAPLVGLFAATSLAAADLIPLKNGIFVPAASRCKGASRAEMVNYWGGKTSIGSGMAGCEIRTIRHKGNVYTYTDVCTDVASGEKIDGSDPTTLTVLSPISFRMGLGKDASLYKYCGPRPVD